ncbi:methionyl-tRNA formyltransferase [Leptospira ognonensis]|uniref:Methionyl-tRNA formyltransferase n=1 Tax=Leptospira ognonensis TaxID=2484945 RepID=A0A4V6QM38_9LEPT|nr:methionyl-tRNA formyltransferase [Leptospira ognonensis]
MSISIGYFGSPHFSAKVLEDMLTAGIKVDFVVTNIDKPVGRKKELTGTPVKQIAQKYNIPVLQSERLRLDAEIQNKILSFPSDLHVVFAYGSIIPENVFTAPKYGSINLHGSLLPKFRGASPVQSFLLSGETETGFTIQYLAREVDSGDIIYSEKWESSIQDTTESLLAEITEKGSKKIISLIKSIPEVSFSRIPQKHEEATHCRKITSENRPIDWVASAFSIHNQIRALFPDPLAYTTFREKRIILLRSSLAEGTTGKSDKKAGSFFLGEKKRLFCVCGDGNLLGIEQVQPEGKKPMSGFDFFNGARAQPEETFL